MVPEVTKVIEAGMAREAHTGTDVGSANMSDTGVPAVSTVSSMPSMPSMSTASAALGRGVGRHEGKAQQRCCRERNDD